MDYVVRLQLAQVGGIAPVVLWHHLTDVSDVLHHVLALLIRQVGQAFVLGNGLVGEETDDDVAVLGTLVDDVNQSRVHDVGNHS